MGSDKGQLQCGVSIDLNKSQYDLSTYLGRAKHFFSVTDPRLAFVSSTKLDEAKQLVTDYEAGKQKALEESKMVGKLIGAEEGKEASPLKEGLNSLASAV